MKRPKRAVGTMGYEGDRSPRRQSFSCLCQRWLEGIVRDLNDLINVRVRDAEQAKFQRRGDRDGLRLTESYDPFQRCQNIVTHHLIFVGFM